ncbi:MAG: NnrU family protein [Hyphomicrobiaceae bacterium]|nr:NnrU family protein [Hyphomicrobiaceae bacterium]
MLDLVIGILIFFSLHMLPTQPDVRAGFVDRFGENAYKGAFSLLSLIGLAVIVYGYHKLQVNPGKNPVLWDSPTWTKHIAFLLMIPAMIALVAAYVPSRIRTALKHPMLVAVKIWALAHLIANGDLGSLVLFGSFLAWAVFDRISLKEREGGRGPLGDAKGGLTGDIVAVGGGLALYAFMMVWGHQHLIGKALIGG